ncbi:MAG: hypothetical protein QG635_101, partial [Bacteroidota bacterium]|nr:hypothetical protein [Bacteroidota bacterium]
MKVFIFIPILILIPFIIFSQEEDGFYSVQYTTNKLVFIKTDGTIKEIGSLGQSIGQKYFGLAFDKKGQLWLFHARKLFKIDHLTGKAELYKILKYSYDSTQGFFGDIAFDEQNRMFIYMEIPSNPEGSLGIVDTNT